MEPKDKSQLNPNSRNANFLKAPPLRRAQPFWRPLRGSSDARQAALPVARRPQHRRADAGGPGADSAGEHEAWAL